MNDIKITSSNLRGTIKIPPSKSLCHRAIICAGLSKKISNIENIIFSDDIIATCTGMQNFGVTINKFNDSLIIKGNEFLKINSDKINCKESGSTLRFLIPLALLTGQKITFFGEGRLSERPLTSYYEIFEYNNVNYSRYDHNNKKALPLTLEGKIKPGEYKLAGNISSQFITGLMFVLPILNGDSRIVVTTELESKGYVDLTIEVLKKFSIHIENFNYKEFIIKGNQKYEGINYRIEGDFSQAAFWIAAGILGTEIECVDLNIDSWQGDRVIIDIIREMGGNIFFNGDKVIAKKSHTNGITIDASNCPDLVPILAVLGSLSKGTTRIINAARLRIKESDRLKAISTELNKLGSNIKETEDGLIIEGKEKLKGGIVDSWNDHRIAMALSIAAIKCEEAVIIRNSNVIKKSYPAFYEDYKALGGIVHEWRLG